MQKDNRSTVIASVPNNRKGGKIVRRKVRFVKKKKVIVH